MKKSNRLILLIGLVLAVAAFAGIFIVLNNGGTQQTVVEPKVKFITAAVDIPIGTPITVEMLGETEVNLGTQPADSFALKEALIGKIARTEIKTGAYIPLAAFSDVASQDNIARLLPTGYRAIAVKVDQVNGVGTLIRPGDYVDVIVTLGGGAFPVVTTNPETKTPEVVAGVNATSVKDVIQNVQVLGTLDSIDSTAAAPAATGANGAAVAPAGETASDAKVQIAILAVTAQQAEVIRFGEIEGVGSTITLVLRSIADKDAPPDDTTGITLRQLVDRWAVLPPQIVETVLPD